jgi:tetratricopeptide (TPR) repeat protein
VASDGVTIQAAAQLLDRLSAADEAPFIAAWIESVVGGRIRMDPALSVRLLRAYRETGRVDRARDLASSLPASPSSWNPLDIARLAIERAILAMIDGRPDHGEAELRSASRALGQVQRGGGLREQLDLHLVTAQLEIRQNRVQPATAALRLAEHVAERLEDGAWRAPVAMTLGHLSMRVADPKTAVKHYRAGLIRSPARGMAALSAHGNLAIALGSIGRFDDARAHAQHAIGISSDLAAGWRHADAYDILAIVEIAADKPLAALHAIDEALVVLGDLEQPTLRYQLAEHRTWALAMLGRAQAARQWLTRADKARSELSAVDTIDAQDLVATRARTAEAAGQYKEAIDIALPAATHLGDAFVTGSLNLVLARSALAAGETALAQTAVERAALSGDKHGWVFPERSASAAAWELAKRSGDSRVVRYAEHIATFASPAPLASTEGTRAEAEGEDRAAQPTPLRASIPPQSDLETLIYVTTAEGVSRVRKCDLERATTGASLVVDTLSHALRVQDRAVSLERRRALEPLVVQLLRRAREGLLGEEVLRAAGGPGHESADAEHRVRVLISRVRDLLGDATSIERVRDAGEYGKTRYRLRADIRFALVEPLYSPEAR